MAGYYDIGDVVRVAVNFKTDAGVDVDPSTVTVKVRLPDGTITTKIYGTDVEVVKDSTGDYHYDVLIAQEGLHEYRWTGSGLIAPGAGESSFVVRETPFA